jgi:hypothetical protein
MWPGRSTGWNRRARGARLMVLPELCNSGYVFESRDEAFALSERLADGDTIRTWSALAAQLGVTLVVGCWTAKPFSSLANASLRALINGLISLGMPSDERRVVRLRGVMRAAALDAYLSGLSTRHAQ